MLFKVGDKVRIRKDADFHDSPGYDDKMIVMKNENNIYTICKVDPSYVTGCGKRLYLLEDNSWSWCECWLEKVFTKYSDGNEILQGDLFIYKTYRNNEYFFWNNKLYIVKDEIISNSKFIINKIDLSKAKLVARFNEHKIRSVF